MNNNQPLIAIVTTCHEDWGGSEELWAKTIPYLQAAGYKVAVLKQNLNKTHPEYLKLQELNVALFELEPKALMLYKRVKNKIINRLKKTHIEYNAESNLRAILKRIIPQLTIISQGINFDGIGMAYNCSLLNLEYAIISQKAVDFYWPSYIDRINMRNVYLKAKKTYFVSNHNKTLTEEQFGARFPNAQVIVNPIKVSRKIIPMPDAATGYRLACVGRYFLLDKGQDILIRIMAQPKWKERPVNVTFIGAGIDKDGLKDMAALLDVTNVEFLNQVDNIAEIWKHYHALILPSRSEGTPLVLLEAMACGRPAIVSTAGGNTEFITDGLNGFIGQPNEQDFDAAMERAWQMRQQWAELGKNGLDFIEKTIPYIPEELLANSLINIAH